MQTADFLRSSILQGSLPVGSRIVERTVAEQLGTSLTAVREALVQLESEGLIVKKPNSTTHVVSLEAPQINQIFDVRAVLECHAMELAAACITAEQVGELETLHHAALSAAKKNQSDEYIKLDLHWHEKVWQVPGNPYLFATIRRLVLPLFVYSTLRISVHGFDLLADAGTHAPIMEALSSGSPKTARKVFLAALARWRLEALGEEESSPATRTR